MLKLLHMYIHIENEKHTYHHNPASFQEDSVLLVETDQELCRLVFDRDHGLKICV